MHQTVSSKEIPSSGFFSDKGCERDLSEREWIKVIGNRMEKGHSPPCVSVHIVCKDPITNNFQAHTLTVCLTQQDCRCSLRMYRLTLYIFSHQVLGGFSIFIVLTEPASFNRTAFQHKPVIVCPTYLAINN